MSSSFWKEALARLPQHVQHRHAGAFEAAEQIEQVLDFAWQTGRRLAAMGRSLAAQKPAASPNPLKIKTPRLLLPR